MGLENIALEEVKQKLGAKNIKISNQEITFETSKTPDLKSIIRLNQEKVKRDYRIKTHGKSTSPSLAYAMIALSEFNSKQSLLDPLTIDGTIPIEAYQFSKGRVIAATESIGYLRSSRINSKIAQANIEFIHEKLENLSKKIDKVDIITTYLISPSKTVAEKTAQKLYKIFLETTDKLLNQNGKLVILINKKDLFLSLCKLKLTKEIKTQSGEEINYILKFKKHQQSHLH